MVKTGVDSYLIPHGNWPNVVRVHHHIDLCHQATCGHRSTPASDGEGVHLCSGVCVDTAALRGVFWRAKHGQLSIFRLKFSPSPPPCVTLARRCRHSHIRALGDSAASHRKTVWSSSSWRSGSRLEEKCWKEFDPRFIFSSLSRICIGE